LRRGHWKEVQCLGGIRTHILLVNLLLVVVRVVVIARISGGKATVVLRRVGGRG
jgi:hypothetical protein